MISKSQATKTIERNKTVLRLTCYKFLTGITELFGFLKIIQKKGKTNVKNVTSRMLYVWIRLQAEGSTGLCVLIKAKWRNPERRVREHATCGGL